MIEPDRLFRALSDKTRLRSLMLLVSEGELCVCELTYALDISQPKISRHLALLREEEIVSVRKEGLWVFYSIASSLDSWEREILQRTAQATADSSPFSEDRLRLQTMSDRPESPCKTD